MEPVWEDPPVSEAPFFTRDQYDTYSLAPNIRELWAFLQSPVENTNTEQKCDVGAAEASCSASTKEAAEFKDNSCISKEESRRDSCDSDDQCADNSGEGTEQCADAEESKEKPVPVKDEPDAAYPEPRLPYPCKSSMSKKEQNMYLDILMSKNTRDPPEWLIRRVNNEVMQFMGYLQDVAKTCADDYNFISHAATQYSEEFFRGCLMHIKTIPQVYQIHEMTSLTGGTFNPELKLTFEKQLLIMGNVDITDHKMVPADTQLASDYQSVSSENPPAKKAKDMHATVSSDGNAENLCARYEPHVCLTRDALVRLLDNHGPDFGEQWELPVLVKLNPGKGNSQKKTVYIDSPLLKTEMTVRERNHIYHEESLKLSIKKNGSVKVFHVMTELPVSEQLRSLESSQRNVVPFEKSGLDFEVDLTDLETFGESTPIRTKKMKKRQIEQQNVCDENEQASSPPLNETKMSDEHLSSSQEEMDTSLTNVDDPRREETNQPVLSETTVPKTEQRRQDCPQESDVDHTFTEDSDDEKLVIDDSVISAAKHPKSKNTPSSSDPPITPVSESVPVNSVSSSPRKVARQRRQLKRAKVPGDQLSEILHMQTAMFSSANDTAKSSTVSQEINSPTRCTGPSVHSHPMSLVKPCVTSYLERNQSPLAPQKSAPVHNITITEHKKLLSVDLQAGAEDEQDYKAPEEGNLLYKLYSLQDLLLMVRSSIALTHTRKTVNGQNQYVPVHLLPKLEYQLCYGVECLTSSEACQLWTETLLHSSNVSYTAHINAHTSKVALLRKLPDNWKENISCGFKPSKSLNILHHLLKKLTGLEEGRYLIAHKAGEPFVTLLKVANGSRGGYNLQQIHSSVPRPPASGLLPWIPVDPSVVLPFHQKHGRVPCTFPIKPFKQKGNTWSSKPNNCGGGQSKNNSNAGGKTKKKKSRAAKRKKYIDKLIQKAV